MKVFGAFLVLLSLSNCGALPQPEGETGEELQPRIVGGVDAKLLDHKHPEIVGILIPDTNAQRCAGTIINEHFILTAAHCCTFPPSAFTVIAGARNLNRTEHRQQRRNVDYVIIHHKWKEYRHKFDICLLKLTHPLYFNKFVQPTHLPKSCFKETGKAEAFGWGRISTDGELPDNLRTVDLPILHREKCGKTFDALYDDDFHINDCHICAGGEEGENECSGDSGGPLYIKHYHEEIQVGLDSFGHPDGCAKEDFPNVFTRICCYIDWIEDHIGLPCPHPPTYTTPYPCHCDPTYVHSNGKDCPCY